MPWVKQNKGPKFNCESCFADSSSIFTFPSLSVVRPQTWHPSISPLYDILDNTNQIFSENQWRPLSTHSPITTPLLPKYKYTNKQIHKYTNIAWVKVIGTTCAIFFKKRTSKIMFPSIWCADLVKVPDRPTEDIKNNVPESVWRSNTQIVEVQDLHSRTGSN